MRLASVFLTSRARRPGGIPVEAFDRGLAPRMLPAMPQRSINNVDSTSTTSAPGVSSSTSSTRISRRCSRTRITSEAIGALLDR